MRKAFGPNDRPKLVGILCEDNLLFSESGELIGTYQEGNSWFLKGIYSKPLNLIQIRVTLNNDSVYNGSIVKGNKTFVSKEYIRDKDKEYIVKP